MNPQYRTANAVLSSPYPHLKSAPVFQKSPLKELYLNDNQLVELAEGAFDELGDLQSLVLSYNQLDTLTQGVFDGLDNLGRLHLNDNQLVELGDLEYLSLNYNHSRHTH